MTTEIAISETLSIRDCGYDEDWLQSKIAADPSILGLGDLELVGREKKQSMGRVDLVLRNQDDERMCEVEVMLGEIDADHIIRAVEYWDRETRCRPRPRHFAVLVSESIGRFSNVLQILSRYIPIIAVQANVIEANGAPAILHFAKILDAYEEPEDEASGPREACDESWWSNYAATNLETAKALLKVVLPVYNDRIELAYTQSYISLRADYNHFTLRASRGNSLVEFYIKLSDGDAVSDAFKKKHLPLDRAPSRDGSSVWMRARADRALVEENADLFQLVAELVKKCWS
jgi:hypothetical protein